MAKCKNSIISDGLSKKGLVTPKKDIVRLSFPTLSKIIPVGNSNFAYDSGVVIPDDMVGDDGVGSLLHRVGVVIYRDKESDIQRLKLERVFLYYLPFEGQELIEKPGVDFNTFEFGATVLVDATFTNAFVGAPDGLTYFEMRRARHESYFTNDKVRPMGAVYGLFSFSVTDAEEEQTFLITPFTDFACLKD